jgi:hypothetical protein
VHFGVVVHSRKVHGYRFLDALSAAQWRSVSLCTWCCGPFEKSAWLMGCWFELACLVGLFFLIVITLNVAVYA